jgi:Clr5 domain
MNSGEAQGSDPFFLNVPFSKRWDFHKATIQRLYIDEGYGLPALVKTMKDDYKFDAV